MIVFIFSYHTELKRSLDDKYCKSRVPASMRFGSGGMLGHAKSMINDTVLIPKLPRIGGF